MCRQDLLAAFHYRAGISSLKLSFRICDCFQGSLTGASIQHAAFSAEGRTEAFLKRDASLQTGFTGYAFVLTSNNIDSEEISSIVSVDRPLGNRNRLPIKFFSAIFYFFLRFLMFINWPEVSEVSILASRD